jgi:transcriptional regulator with XRE-family HTH domain
MDELRVGAVIRALRLRRRWTQAQLGLAASVARALVARIERGQLEAVAVGRLRHVGATVGVRLEFIARTSIDADRLINARHAAMHESMARMFRSLDGWVAWPEVSFSIYGERGVIDIVAWHAGRRALLIIELKTSLVDVNDLLGSMDRRMRLARTIARERGLDPKTVSSWVVLAETPTNHRRLAEHVTVLRSSFPSDGRLMRCWLRDPSGAIAVLSFIPTAVGKRTSIGSDRRERVRRTVADRR